MGHVRKETQNKSLSGKRNLILHNICWSAADSGWKDKNKEEGKKKHKNENKSHKNKFYMKLSL